MAEDRGRVIRRKLADAEADVELGLTMEDNNQRETTASEVGRRSKCRWRKEDR